MANDLNKVMLIGRLGKDPEMHAMPSGDQVANFNIATGSSWKNKETGEKQERTEWHRISVFGGLAKICGQYLHKGSQVFIEGELRTRKWQDKQGQDRYTTEIICQNMQMIGGKSDGAGAANRPPPPQERPTGAPGRSQNNAEDFDDDIPF